MFLFQRLFLTTIASLCTLAADVAGTADQTDHNSYSEHHHKLGVVQTRRVRPAFTFHQVSRT